MVEILCRECQTAFEATSAKRKVCDACKKRLAAEYTKKYRASEKGAEITKAVAKRFRDTHKEELAARHKEWRKSESGKVWEKARYQSDEAKQAHRERVKAWSETEEGRAYRREYSREYATEHSKDPERREYHKACSKEYMRSHPEARAKSREWLQSPDGRAFLESYKPIQNRRKRDRYKDDPSYCIEMRLRGRLVHAVERAGGAKSDRTFALTGCSLRELLTHLEALFLPGVSWENRSEWHIDHIIPCSAFDLTDPAQQSACFHYTNLQPLWRADNIRKGGARKSERREVTSDG